MIDATHFRQLTTLSVVGVEMPHSKPIHYANAGPKVRAVYDEIKATRGVDDINNFWKHVANPHLL